MSDANICLHIYVRALRIHVCVMVVHAPIEVGSPTNLPTAQSSDGTWLDEGSDPG